MVIFGVVERMENYDVRKIGLFLCVSLKCVISIVAIVF